uniref:Uncharacterized protein n=1 Tax=Helianthus annuus TaxID=4232 RepID=A0A251RSV2_HELAN
MSNSMAASLTGFSTGLSAVTGDLWFANIEPLIMDKHLGLQTIILICLPLCIMLVYGSFDFWKG